MTTYNINIDSDGNGTIAVNEPNGDSFHITSDMPGFAKALVACQEGATIDQIRHDVRGLDQFEALSDRVQLKNGTTLLFDGEPVHTRLSQAIMRYRDEGRPFMGLVRFMERMAENPSFHSRKQGWEFIDRCDGLTVDEDGFFIGYKGVRDNGTSVNSGKAMVDGVEVEGHIPNAVGSVISMPRHMVDDDHNVDCSHGLHVGTKEYASSFGNKLLVVAVDPKDMVSVPHRGTDKLRCCRYEVRGVYEPEVDWEPEGDPGDDPIEQVAQIVPETFFRRLREKLLGARS